MSGLTRSELLALPAVVDLVTACEVLQIGRTLGYELAGRGEFPVPVLRLGRLYRVPTAQLLTVLGVTPTNSDGAGAHNADPAQTTPYQGDRHHAHLEDYGRRASA